MPLSRKALRTGSVAVESALGPIDSDLPTDSIVSQFFRFSVCLSTAFGVCLASVSAPPLDAREPARTMLATLRTVRPPGLDERVFQLAFGAGECAVRAGAVNDPSTLTVVDYSRPSTEKRLWVFDLSSGDLLYEEPVAHGRASGADIASQFSNEPNTRKSSLGLFVTGDAYYGRNGYSLRLDGLDEGFNDRARERAIVMHGAPYVSAQAVRKLGHLGRSWGCPAVRDVVARELIDRVKGGSLLFVYYPDPQWLAASKYLGDCPAAD
jgi:hypothetical protein